MTTPLITPGTALEIAKTQTSTMGTQPTTTTTPTPSVPSSGSFDSYMTIAKSQGGGLKEAQTMFQNSLRAGTSSINGNSNFVENDQGVLVTAERQSMKDTLINKLNGYFNGKQITQYEDRNTPVTASSDPYSAYAPVLSTPENSADLPTVPETYSAVDEYNKLSENAGLTDLNNRLAELEKQKREMEAQRDLDIKTQEGNPVAMGVIAGRVGELETIHNEKIDRISREIAYTTDTINTKNASIQMIMDFKKEDYNMANDRYKMEYDKAVKTQELMRQQSQDALTQQDKEQDNYRAMYTTVYNSIATGAVNPEEFTPEMKAQFSTLEMKAGLPIGFTEMIRNKNPKADIIYQGTTTDNDGNQMLNLVMRDATGKITTQNMLVGKEGTKGRYQYRDDGTIFDSSTGMIIDNSSMDTADFRVYASKYPNEASLKNNNPAGMTFRFGDGSESKDFQKYLSDNGVQFSEGTSRPKGEGGTYFQFDTVGDGMRAYNLLWATSKYQNMTVGSALARWGTGALSGIDTSKKVSQLTPEETQQLQIAQMKKESPGFYTELQKLGTKKTTESEQKLNTSLRTDASDLVVKIQEEGMDFNTAHAKLYTKYSGQLKELGYSDAEVKQALHNLLGGK